MQEIFEKIKDRFMKVGNIQFSNYTKPLITVEDAIKIVNQVAEETSTGEISDGYHTFNELYHHRAVLFSVICNTYKELAWKSKLHDTGDMYDGMFIVGIETPEGQATYHYDVDPYWDMFDVKELPKAHKWDGHTPDEAIRRIGLLGIDTNVGNNDDLIIHVMHGYDSLEAPNGEMCFGCYVKGKYEIYVADDIPKEQFFQTIAHEYMHYLQDIEDKDFSEEEADAFAGDINVGSNDGCCEWFKYNYRTIAPKNHDIGNPYWRIPENWDKIKYCPYCGKKIKVVE